MNSAEIEQRILNGIASQNSLLFCQEQSCNMVRPWIVVLACHDDGQGIRDTVVKLELSCVLQSDSHIANPP